MITRSLILSHKSMVFVCVGVELDLIYIYLVYIKEISNIISSASTSCAQVVSTLQGSVGEHLRMRECF